MPNANNIQNMGQTTNNRLAKIIHLMTTSTQYGYKSGLSTIGAIIKLEHAIQTGPDSANIVLMGLSKAFGSVNRRILWETLYKTGLPIPTIKHIMHGHQSTTPRCNDNGTYGTPVINNVGVFQGSALSALLFIIYLEDMMQDYQAMRDYLQLPKRMTAQAAPTTHTENLLLVQNNQQNDTNTQQVQTQNTQPERKTQQSKNI